LLFCCYFILEEKSVPEWKVLLLRWADAQQLAVDLVLAGKVRLVELLPPFHLHVDQLMVDRLAAVVDHVGYRNEAGLAEVIPKAPAHNGSVAKVKLSLQFFL
jgi:hypothetical protein